MNFAGCIQQRFTHQVEQRDDDPLLPLLIVIPCPSTIIPRPFFVIPRPLPSFPRKRESRDALPSGTSLPLKSTSTLTCHPPPLYCHPAPFTIIPAKAGIQKRPALRNVTPFKVDLYSYLSSPAPLLSSSALYHHSRESGNPETPCPQEHHSL